MNKLDKIDNIFVVVVIYTTIASFFITPAFIYSLFQKWYIVKGFKVIEGATTDDWTWEACLYNLNKKVLDGMIEVQAEADYLFHKNDYGQVLGKMLNNKVETAYNMIISGKSFNIPQYIKDAIEWLRK